MLEKARANPSRGKETKESIYVTEDWLAAYNKIHLASIPALLWMTLGKLFNLLSSSFMICS